MLEAEAVVSKGMEALISPMSANRGWEMGRREASVLGEAAMGEGSGLG